MKFRPLQDRILVRRRLDAETTRGGIIIPDAAREKSAEGEVIAVGPGKINDAGAIVPIEIKAGDRVLFTKYAGGEIRLDEDDYIVLRAEEVLAVLTGTDGGGLPVRSPSSVDADEAVDFEELPGEDDTHAR